MWHVCGCMALPYDATSRTVPWPGQGGNETGSTRPAPRPTLHSGGTHWKMKLAEATPSSASSSASEPHSPASSVGLEPMPPAGAGAGGAGWPGWACGRGGHKGSMLLGFAHCHGFKRVECQRMISEVLLQ